MQFAQCSTLHGCDFSHKDHLVQLLKVLASPSISLTNNCVLASLISYPNIYCVYRYKIFMTRAACHEQSFLFT